MRLMLDRSQSLKNVLSRPSETGLAESGSGGISLVVSVEGSDSEDRDDNSLTGTRFS